MIKAYKSEINEIAQKGKFDSGGPLELISKVDEKESEIKTGEQDNSEEEHFLVNFEEEAIAYYSNSKLKRFFNKPLNPKCKSNSELKGNSALTKVVKVDLKEEKKDSKNCVEKKQLKLKGDSGYICYYCNGSNQFAKDYMLQKKKENKERV